MLPHLRVFPRETLDLGVAEATAQAGVELAREIVVELGEELDVEEEDGGGGEFVGDDVEEDLGAMVFGGFGAALFGLEGKEAHLEDGGAVAEKDGFSAFERGQKNELIAECEHIPFASKAALNPPAPPTPLPSI